ncbi:Uncharacterised protein [Legionella beliardensis]|uniref:Leucine-rich repeat domain-containing protein n=1 Tax=Legionella beliardensis TaxID=91822 RepID=A0A378HYD2_9GAMM|nr:leucine-rich repeat domain-containing protein [Legionella beliardensis]STX27907.1 Uncharacterised protein [Legionella beliardensis]
MLSDDGKILLRVDESDIVDGSYQIPVGVTSISDEAFIQCRSLQTIMIPDGVTNIGEWAFVKRCSLQTITIADGVTNIGEGAFSKCRSLQTVIIPAGVTIIDDFVFAQCTNLRAITIPVGVTAIGLGAFDKCRSLQTITIPTGVTTIYEGAFANCSSLQMITLPAGVKTIGDGAFEGCEKLAWIIIDSDDQADLGRITALLPEELSSKVIPKSLYVEVIRQLQDKHLARILSSPHTNQLYRFFHVNTRYVSKVNIENEEQRAIEKAGTTIPEEIFCHINAQGADANRYYQKAKALIEREPWPKAPEELKGYEERLINIVTKCIKQAEHFHVAIEENQTASPVTPFN